MKNHREWLRTEGDINLSDERERFLHNHQSTTTREVLEQDAAYFLHQTLSTPCLNVIEECEGIYLIDAEGRRIMDFHGNNLHQVGFRHPKVIAAIKAQLDVLPFSTRRYTNRAAVELAQRLTALTPGDLKRVLFAPAATLATGMALKLSRLVTGRYKTLSMWDSFHGASMDAISAAGEVSFRRGLGPLLPGSMHVPPYQPRDCVFGCGGTCPGNCADYVEYVLEKDGEIGAVIIETVRNTDVRIPTREYLQRIQSACRRHGALLIVDETAIAFGRTGKMFAFEHFDLEPDMVIFGKGIGGAAMPLAGLLVRDRFNAAGIATSIGHYTHEKNPLAAAAALATLDVIEQEQLCERASELGMYFRERLERLLRKYPVVDDVRGIGLLYGLELKTEDGLRESSSRLAERIMYRALERGLSFKVSKGNVITLAPALIITKEQLDEAVAILEEAIDVSLDEWLRKDDVHVIPR
ncbi:MAG: aspartate aminotransferase family protein [Alicyclobacillus sp.]|nr:aspartate aminotransferase family protein [Alicyclobacillus sp.]